MSDKDKSWDPESVDALFHKLLLEEVEKALYEEQLELEKRADRHREGLSDMEWAQSQPAGIPAFGVGDVVKFRAGGIGVITGISEPRNGWPWSCSVAPVPGFPYHPLSKMAWHYELDLEGKNNEM